MREKLKEQAELMGLDEECKRIAENETIYLDEVSHWRRLDKAIVLVVLILFVIAIASLSSLPPNTQMNFETFPQYPLQYSLFWLFIAMAVVSLPAKSMLSSKIAKIRGEMGLHKEESLYLHAYETYRNVESYVKETNLKRKVYFRRMAVRSAKELVEIVEGWKYGNIRLIANLIGQDIDLLRDNMKRLVLANVAKGDESNLVKVTQILIEFCRYLRSPSIEKLGELNENIKDLPYREYKFITKRERLSGYLQSKPRAFRLLFAFSVTTIFVLFLSYMGQDIGLTIAVSVPCFWGAFMGFDKLFRIKEREEVERISGRLRAYASHPKTPKENNEEEGENL